MNTNTETHRRTEELLRRLGWLPHRQIEPKRGDGLGRGEVFELWERGTELVWVQFYGAGNGVEFYSKATSGNTWAEVERVLAAPRDQVAQSRAELLTALQAVLAQVQFNEPRCLGEHALHQTATGSTDGMRVAFALATQAIRNAGGAS